MQCDRCFDEYEDYCATCRSNDYFRKKGVVITKTCIFCGVIRPLASNQQCKKCLKLQGLKECYVCKEIRLEHLDFGKKHSICKGCRGKSLGLTPKEKSIHMRLMKSYGIGLRDYDMMLVSQEGGCLICGEAPVGQNLVVDHDHKTGKVRGLLCSNCNLGLGHFLDRPDLLKAAANYLEIFDSCQDTQEQQ